MAVKNSLNRTLQLRSLRLTTKTFWRQIVIHKGKIRRGNIVFSSSITEEDAFRTEANMKCNIDIKAREIAYVLKSEILKAQKTPLPENLTIKGILKGEVKVPDTVNKFFNDLIYGPDI